LVADNKISSDQKDIINKLNNYFS